MENNKEYYAFISYKREDEKWAKWLQYKLEHYRFPTTINGVENLPKNIHPTFRDVTDLIPGVLTQEINNALRSSMWLIVICSPRSAKSEWVCKEAQTFIDLGYAHRIIPFVIEGVPFSGDVATECYPESLRNLVGSRELLAANIKEMGRDAAFVKVVAKMFGLKFDTLWNRYERELRRIRFIKYALVVFFLLLVGALTFTGVNYYNKKVLEYCTTGIKSVDGLFDAQRNLLKYKKYSWLLSKETRSVLKQVIYEVDYSYNIQPFPIIHSYKLEGGMIEQLDLGNDESQILVAGSDNSSGVLNCRESCFKSFDMYTSSIGYAKNSNTIVACGLKVAKYSNKIKKIDEFDVDGYGMVVNPDGRHFVCIKYNELMTFSLDDGSKIFSRHFDKDIVSYSYNKSGNSLAVVSADSLLSLISVATGEIICQRKFETPVLAITASQSDDMFFVACSGDSTRVAKVRVDTSDRDTILFTVPNSASQKNKLSFTQGDYLAFSNGRYLVLYNMQTKDSYPMDAYSAYRSDIEDVVMSPSGTKICYSINSKIYVMEIKEAQERQMFPIKNYGLSLGAIPTVAKLYPNDTTIVMAAIINNNLSSVAKYNLRSGERLGKTIETNAPVLKVLPMLNDNHAAVAFSESNSWDVVDFTTAQAVKKIIVEDDTLSYYSNLALTANRKYLIGTYIGKYRFCANDTRCVLSPETYECVDSVYWRSYPLQDGEHFYRDHNIYTYPEKELLFQTNLISFMDGTEIFDDDKIAYKYSTCLCILDLKQGNLHSINLKSFVQGDVAKYELLGYKNGYALLFNNSHLVVIDTRNEEIVMQKISIYKEQITSASFFNNQSRILLTTSNALCMFDIMDYDELCDVWRERLFD